MSACNAGDPGSIPGSGRSPGEGNGNPLQYSCLENPMDGEASQATVHGVTKSRTQLNDNNDTHPERDTIPLISRFVSLRPPETSRIKSHPCPLMYQYYPLTLRTQIHPTEASTGPGISLTNQWAGTSPRTFSAPA